MFVYPVVLFTDQPNHVDSDDLLRRNCRNNDVTNYQLAGFDWRQSIDEQFIVDNNLTQIDYIFASDCFYDPRVFDACISAIDRLLRVSTKPTCICLFSYEAYLKADKKRKFFANL